MATWVDCTRVGTLAALVWAVSVSAAPGHADVTRVNQYLACVHANAPPPPVKFVRTAWWTASCHRTENVTTSFSVAFSDEIQFVNAELDELSGTPPVELLVSEDRKVVTVSVTCSKDRSAQYRVRLNIEAKTTPPVVTLAQCRGVLL